MMVTSRIFKLGEALPLISEWQSPNFQNLPQVELMLLIALYMCLSRGLKLPTLRLLIVLGLLHLFLQYVRGVDHLAMLVPLIVAPVMARQYPSLRPGTEPSGRSLFVQKLSAMGGPAGRNAVALFVLLGAVYAGGQLRFGGIRPPNELLPTAALDFIRQANLQGNVFNRYGFGGSLINAGIKTFIDGRAELYGGDFVKRYAKIVNVKGERVLDEALDEFNIEWTFLLKDQPANAVLAHLPDWKRIYSDDTATIYARQH
jgi:hypothetical protein